MNIEIETEAAQFSFWEYFCHNFRYSIFAATNVTNIMNSSSMF